MCTNERMTVYQHLGRLVLLAEGVRGRMVLMNWGVRLEQKVLDLTVHGQKLNLNFTAGSSDCEDSY
jgi:hypothetical protein